MFTYITGSAAAGKSAANAAVREARRGSSVLIRARAHAVQAEMAARSGQPRHAAAALHLTWHDVDQDTTGDQATGAFTRAHMRSFDGVCGIWLGEAEAAGRQLAASAAALTGSAVRAARHRARRPCDGHTPRQWGRRARSSHCATPRMRRSNRGDPRRAVRVAGRAVRRRPRRSHSPRAARPLTHPERHLQAASLRPPVRRHQQRRPDR